MIGRWALAVIGRWVDLWDRRESPVSLALLRILVALALLGDLTQARMRGAIEPVWAPPPLGAGSGQLGSAPPLLVSWLGPSANTAHVAWWLAVLAALLVLAGVAFRISAWLLVFAMIQLWRITPDGEDGIDVLLRLVLPLLAFSGANAIWSVDAWLARRLGRPFADVVPAWPRYLIVVQVLWVYFSAAHHRGLVSWGPSSGFAAVGDVLGDPHFARFFPGSLRAGYPLMQLGTALTMLFEHSAPLFLLWTWLDKRPGRGGRFGEAVRRLRVRWIWLALGISLHAGIAVTMQLGMFPFGILALYPALFGPEDVTGLLQRLRRRGAFL